MSRLGAWLAQDDVLEVSDSQAAVSLQELQHVVDVQRLPLHGNDWENTVRLSGNQHGNVPTGHSTVEVRMRAPRRNPNVLADPHAHPHVCTYTLHIRAGTQITRVRFAHAWVLARSSCSLKCSASKDIHCHTDRAPQGASPAVPDTGLAQRLPAH
eukprot:9484953-Pyramimonas_sp.AAC.1